MKKLIILLFFTILPNAWSTQRADSDNYGNVFVDVDNPILTYNGKTFRADLKGYPTIIGSLVRIEIAGIAVPDAIDDRAGHIKSTAFTNQKLNNAKVIALRNMHRGQEFFGIVADVYVDGKNLGEMLMSKGLGLPVIPMKKFSIQLQAN